MSVAPSADFRLRVAVASLLTGAEREQVFALFEETYREANRAYLEASLGKLRNAALAYHGDELAGFAVGELRVLDLPRLPAQPVAMAGMCCVAPQFRRRGLFGALERLAIAGGEPLAPPPQGRMLSVGRMAHPVSFRTMNPVTRVPRLDVPPTRWQREVGAAVAAAYGVPDFDQQTFVCRGTGVPIGYPIIEMDVSPQEWTVFQPVDRSRGDSLLGLSWMPDVPPGWFDDG